MKKAIVYSIAALLFAGIVGFKSLTEKILASVNQVDGLYIFVESVPKGNYKVLGSVKSAGAFGGSQYLSVRDRLLNKAKKEYPNANGIMLYFKDGSTDKADVILIED